MRKLVFYYRGNKVQNDVNSILIAHQEWKGMVIQSNEVLESQESATLNIPVVRRSYAVIKRVMDLQFVCIFFIPSVVIAFFFSIIIMIETRKGPIIAQQRGLFLNKGIFTMYKFRTMIETTIHDARHENDNIFLKRYLASSVTRFGRFLRMTGMDELPQLINIFRGEMSLIGPRPLSVSDLMEMRKKHPKFYQQREHLQLKPGMTCLWQLHGDRRNGFADIIHYDLAYARFCSFTTDLNIFLKTIPLVFFARHADSIVTKRLQKNSSQLDKSSSLNKI